MTLTVLFAADTNDWRMYADPMRDAFADAGLDVDLTTHAAPGTVDYIIYAPTSTVQDFTPFINAKAVLSLWAGVEKIVTNSTLTMPLVRMVDPGMTRSMTEWVAGHVMRYHLAMDAHISNPKREWISHSNPLATERNICILGLGTLGAAVAETLLSLNFNVSGWSRSKKSFAGVRCFYGPDSLPEALATADILVLLLPDTAETENTLDAIALSAVPQGAFVLNPGRGPLIDDNALIAALDRGQVAHATLDVFRIEPLPQDHPFWTHPKITITPHIAAATRPRTASVEIAKSITRGETGQPFMNLVDRARGY